MVLDTGFFLIWLYAWLRWPVYQPEIITAAALYFFIRFAIWAAITANLHERGLL